MLPYLHRDCKVYNTYSLVECGMVTTYHLIDSNILASDKLKSIPIGRPIPNVHCIVLDEHQQPVSTDTIGELYVSGVGIFAGYLDDINMTERVLLEIDGIH
ncbi:unnamed protein product, partial [Rotaria sp. Silwood1]